MSISIPDPPDLALLPISNVPASMSADIHEENNVLFAPKSGIHDVPPEILIQICSYNAYRDRTPCSASPYTYNTTEPRLPQPILDTIYASHVCHRWRNILISAPELWTNMVDPHNAEWMEVILERSRPFGITIVPPPWGDPKTEADFEVEMDCEEVQERLIEYHFTQDADGLKLSRLEGLDHLNLPRLQFLYLDLCSLQELPEQFPGLSTPALKHLYLRGCFTKDVQRLDSISSTLTYLTLAGLYPADKIPTPTLVAIIARLPKLQSVSLCRALAPERTRHPAVLERICIPNFSITDETKLVSYFFECAELTPPFNNVSLHCDLLNDELRSLDHIVSKAVSIFDYLCTNGAFERCGLRIEPGEITYVELLDSRPLDGPQPEERRFHFHISLMEFPSFNFDRLISIFLPTWLYERVEDLTIPAPVFDLLHLELGEDIVIEMLRRFSRVQVLDGVGNTLWDLLYRFSQPLDGFERPILPSLRKIGFHRDYSLSTLESDGANASGSDGIFEEEEEDVEEVNGKLTIAILHPSEELFPKSDSEDGSFVYESGESDYSDFEDSTGFPEPSKLAASYPVNGGKTYPAPYYVDEYTDIREGYIASREISEFCFIRPAIRHIVISNPDTADDHDCEILKSVLAGVGVALEVVTA